MTVNRRGEIIQRTPGRARYYREDLENGVYLDMVYVAGGNFLMGSPDGEHNSDENERPQHLVTVPECWMGKYQVTQAQWKVIMGSNPTYSHPAYSNPAYFKGANRPVERVSWDDCQKFCSTLSERTGKQYQLPSEAEWEYACRAGTTTPFNCGETIKGDLANYDGSDYTYAEERKGQHRKQTVEVGSFPPNAWGFYDMHGNVSEWCKDSWYDNYQGAPTDGSAWINNHSQNAKRVLRGGCWRSNPECCRSAYRFSSTRDDCYLAFGLRLVLLLDKT